jgi:hypothetical protein
VKVASRYPTSYICGVVAVLGAVFVFLLSGYHSYIISLNYTTQEQQSGKYNRFPKSPFSYGSKLANWTNVILWKAKKPMKSRLFWPLYLQTFDPEKYEKWNEKNELPSQMKEKTIELHSVGGEPPQPRLIG